MGFVLWFILAQEQSLKLKLSISNTNENKGTIHNASCCFVKFSGPLRPTHGRGHRKDNLKLKMTNLNKCFVLLKSFLHRVILRGEILNI